MDEGSKIVWGMELHKTCALFSICRVIKAPRNVALSTSSVYAILPAAKGSSKEGSRLAACPSATLCSSSPGKAPSALISVLFFFL